MAVARSGGRLLRCNVYRNIVRRFIDSKQISLLRQAIEHLLFLSSMRQAFIYKGCARVCVSLTLNRGSRIIRAKLQNGCFELNIALSC
jgi:hypothetical protein